MQDSHDVAVIGGGPAGYVAAIRAAQEGARVLLAEKEKLGGTCVNWGCVPTKVFLADVKPFYDIARSSLVADGAIPVPSFEKMLNRKRMVVERMNKGIETLLRSNDIDLIYGKAFLLDAQTVSVLTDAGEERYKTSHIIIATGSQTAKLPNLGMDGESVLSSDDILSLDRVPEEMVIVGGGVIGVEFATIFNALGTQVIILEVLPTVLPAEDAEVALLLSALLQKQGITVRAKTEVLEVTGGGGSVRVTVRSESGGLDTIATERVLVAVGRTPHTTGLGADRVGLTMDGPFIKVNSRMATSVEGIYAVGDVVGKTMLAHAASAEGIVAVDNILGHPREIDYRRIPSCVYCFPEVASIGLNEKEARDGGLDIHIGRFPFQCSAKAVAMREPEGFVKLIADKHTGRLLGAHIIGESATELIGECALAMHLGATVSDLAEVVKGHPTLSETVTEAALEWSGKSIHLPRRGSRS